MGEWYILLAFVVAILLVLVGSFCYFIQHSRPHFRTVRKNVLYRSGQPRNIGLHAVRMHGIRTVVNLRSPESNGLQVEREFNEKYGIAFHNIPVGTTLEGIGESVKEFLIIMNDEANYPVLVHCSRGKERAGLFSAVFRMEFDHWSNQKALSEMQSLGLKPGSMPIAETFIWNYQPTSREQPGSHEVAWQE